MYIPSKYFQLIHYMHLSHFIGKHTKSVQKLSPLGVGSRIKNLETLPEANLKSRAYRSNGFISIQDNADLQSMLEFYQLMLKRF